MIQEHVPQAAPSPGLIFDGETYDIELGGMSGPLELEEPSLPTMDYATHLINTLKFHCCQLFHIFEEDEFMEQMRNFYNQATPTMGRDQLWYVHFLVLIAFGKAFVSRGFESRRPPGSEFFTVAMQQLPHMVVLCNDPLRSTEILCCIALYLQCVDHRIAAYNYVRTQF